MLLIGAQLEVARKELLAGAEVPGPSGLNCKPKGEIQVCSKVNVPYAYSPIG